MKKLFLVLICTMLLVLFQSSASAQKNGKSIPVLPKPCFENCLFVEVQCGRGGQGGSREDKLAELKEFYELVGPQRLYVRVSILSDNWDGRLLTDEDYLTCGMFHAHFGTVIVGPNRKKLGELDARNIQWLSDGTIGFQKEGPPFYTMSRYNDTVWEVMRQDALHAANGFLQALKRGSPISILAIPNELSYYFPTRIGAGYEPHMIAEFRDWLTHRGRYAKGQPFAGEGWPGGEIFTDDPSPMQAKDSHKSFNQNFGTKFKTWTLKYWDPEVFPEPMSPSTETMPAEGQRGHTADGFDAPRTPSDPLLPYWQGMDHKKPSFRALAVQRALTMIQKTINEAGVPKERIFTRSKERWFGKFAEYFKDRPFEAIVPGWTAYTSYGNPGYNFYNNNKNNRGKKPYETVTLNLNEYKRDTWALTEFHPYSDHAMEHSVDDYFNSLKDFFEMEQPPRYIGCAKWDDEKHGNTWRIKGTNFVEALRLFVRWLPDVPYPFKKSLQQIAYQPPSVYGLQFKEENDKINLQWAQQIWESDIVKWSDWGEFANFEVATCKQLDAKGQPFSIDRLGTTKEYVFSISAKKVQNYLCVSAISTRKLKGTWTVIAINKPEEKKSGD